ncbi:uncharacterized protein A1O9_06423 [Exophiala aquamarina CBS 119918]|uniref:Uncharacterized protein n=1 Tax=Exophiala aquamarina CBS 119918 TaxID=1182545 RepID=A0A072PFE7_9EURO|nr:uncharacterized protein A1O9_06423 [Exophiala aquamarina CBS 119918]KEF58497.1 hypothetical protein A1O9_06423 [Exophiala aquamarina CBS 119918]
MIIGPVGCGKSTLIKSILSETHLSQGFLYLRTKSIAFADQEPWIQNGTIRDAIRGLESWENQPLDNQWYQKVIAGCGLLEDLKFLAKGDLTFIGSKGISLSGGQKQRIALARALYARPEMLLLDDVFSGLDNDTEDHIFRQLFGHSGLVRSENITVVVVTHATHRLPYADLIVSLDRNGRVAEQGNYNILTRTGGYVQSLDIKLKEQRQDTTQAATPEDVHTPKVNTASEVANSQSNDDDADRQDLLRRTGDWSAYRYWFQSAGYISSSLSFLEASLWMGAVQTPGILVKIFSNGNSLETTASSARSTTFIAVFGVTTAVAALSLIAIVWQVFLDMVPRSSRNLHLNLLQTVLDAPLSFFTHTDIGTITNRFSQDMGLIDAELPYSYADFVLSLVSCIAGLGLMSSSGSGYFAAIIPVLIFVLYMVQRYYLRTSRQMRLLDLEQKAPLYTMFAETAAGVPTIRAFGWTEKFEERNLTLLDRSQRPFYLMMCIQRWLALVLDMIVVILVTVLVVVIISQRSSIEPGLAGIGLLSTVGLSSSLTTLVRMWSALETSIGAICRLREFLQTTNSEHEPQEVASVRSDWPENGETVATLRNLPIEMTYSSQLYLDARYGRLSKKKGGLDAIMSPDFLSHGQRQLFCLARAMLRESKVLILDEVSANLDVKTDELMQKVIREHFHSCTIIAVAHRLHTIDDGDRVVVLSHGEIAEMDDPRVLLNTSGSRFKELYDKY